MGALPIHQDITGLGLFHVFANEMCVEADKRFGVSEVGEGSVGLIGRRVGSGADPEKVGVERGEGVIVLGNLWNGGEFRQAGGGDPGVIVDGEGLAVAVSDEGGAIGDLPG